MSTLDLSFHKDSLNRSLGYSLMIHALIFSIFTLKTVFFAEEPVLFESAVRVDLVALPDKGQTPEPLPTVTPEAVPAPVAQPEVKPPAAPPAPTLAPKEAPKVIDPEAINLKAAKAKQSAAMQKLKQLSALEAIENDVHEDNKKKAIEKIKQIKGNALSTGSELTGVNRMQHDNYISVVERHIRQNWSLPEWLARKNLKAQIRVRFDEAGNVISRDIYKSSGNASFDEVVIATIEKSSPVPPPPPKFVKILNVEGVLLGFPE